MSAPPQQVLLSGLSASGWSSKGAAGVLEVDDPSAAESGRHYRLPLGHAEVLLNRDSLSYMTRRILRELDQLRALGTGEPEKELVAI